MLVILNSSPSEVLCSCSFWFGASFSFQNGSPEVLPLIECCDPSLTVEFPTKSGSKLLYLRLDSVVVTEEEAVSGLLSLGNTGNRKHIK